MAAVGGWIGIVYIPADVVGFLDAYPSLSGVRRMERETVILLFSGLLVAYIIWADARPHVLRHISNRKSKAILIDKRIYIETIHVKGLEVDGKQIYLNRYYFIVGNGRPDALTLRGVECRLFWVGEPTVCLLKDGNDSRTDIRHGEWAFIEIGEYASFEMHGFVGYGELRDENDRRGYLHNVLRGFMSFRVSGKNKGRGRFGFVHDVNDPPDATGKFSMSAVISADDTPSRSVELHINLSTPKNVVSWSEGSD